MTEKILVLEPGDERAQKIAKAMASQTASDILQILADSPVSLNDIAERLDIPINTAKYHVENLLEAGLISVAETKYSVKGREVKLYTLANQLLVVAPRQSSMRSLILKYATLFGIVAVSSALIAALSPVIRPDLLPGGPGAGPGPQIASLNNVYLPGYGSQAAAEAAAQNVTYAPDVMTKAVRTTGDALGAGNATYPAEPVMYQAMPQVPPDLAQQAVPPGIDPAVAFFFGGVLVIFILLCYEAWLWKKK